MYTLRVRFPELLPFFAPGKIRLQTLTKAICGRLVGAAARGLMATMRELQAEYEVLITTHRRLIEERTQLQSELADGAAFQDHGHRMRAYQSALDTYVLALGARRRELQHKRDASRA